MSYVDPNQLWSRPMLRRLLIKHRVGIGSRVLVVGFVHGPLGARLSQFGLQIHELDESPENVMHARREHDELRIDHWHADEPLPLEADDRYDIILVRNRSEFRRDLFSPHVTQLTADLLAALNPGASLVFMDEFHSEGTFLGHAPDCLANLLSQFPGQVTRKRFRRSLSTLDTWRSLLTTGRRGRREMVSLTIGENECDRNGWRKQALQIACAGGTCCLRGDEATIPIRKAA